MESKPKLSATVFVAVLAWVLVMTTGAVILHYVGLWKGIVLSPPLWMIDMAQQLIWAMIVGSLAPAVPKIKSLLTKEPTDKN